LEAGLLAQGSGWFDPNGELRCVCPAPRNYSVL
jgi:hypothetical protein